MSPKGIMQESGIVFRHVQQLEDSKLCGQACIASVLGISLDEACERVGHRRGTKAKEIALVLGLGAARRVRGPVKVPNILSVRWGIKRDWHWVLFKGDVVMDPRLPYKVDYDVWYRDIVNSGGRITSYLDLSKRWKQRGNETVRSNVKGN